MFWNEKFYRKNAQRECLIPFQLFQPFTILPSWFLSWNNSPNLLGFVNISNTPRVHLEKNMLAVKQVLGYNTASQINPEGNSVMVKVNQA